VNRALVVEDDPALRQTLRSILEGAGYQVRVAGDGNAGVRELQTETFEVVLLDIGLPFIDGWEILAKLESRRIPPVVVVSARGDESDKVRALDLGADDYLAKPFGAEELLARIRAVIRRAQPPPLAGFVAKAGNVVVDLERAVVTKAGTEVRLSPTEFGLISYLARNAGQVKDHRTILRSVWGSAYGDERNYLRTFIGRLRTKLEDDPHNPKIIQTVGTRGYRFATSSII
jgi:two-component system KDP operon response regulator KdpE